MNNIILIGFMGSGKTTVGMQLSKKISLEFIDMDLEIEKESGISISEMFKLYGESYFRKKEVNLLNELLKKDNIIISTGGGIIESEEVINIINCENCVIWLDASEDTIINRLESELDKRPKLKNNKNLEFTIKNLMKSRYKKYKRAANIRINVDGKNIDEVVGEILVYIDKNMLL